MRQSLIHRAARIASVVSIAIAFTACNSDSSTEPGLTPNGSIEISPSSNEVFVDDNFQLHGTVRDASGREVPNAVVTFSSPDSSLVLVAPSGDAFAVSEGTARIVARSGALTAEVKIVFHHLTVSSVVVLGLPDTLASGDLTMFGVRAIGQGGRTVYGREVKLASTNPAAAVIDPSGRVRAVSAGKTTITATADGIVGQASVVVSAEPAQLHLRRSDGQPVPMLVEGDSLSNNGTIEYREIYLESGVLQLTGGPNPGYQTSLHYAWYTVTFDASGQRHFTFKSAVDITDQGTVRYDSRGDLVMTSATSSVSHDAGTEWEGLDVHYRFVPNVAVPPSLLFFRREPK